MHPLPARRRTGPKRRLLCVTRMRRSWKKERAEGVEKVSTRRQRERGEGKETHLYCAVCPPFAMSATMAAQDSTASWLPVMLTWQGSVAWSIWMRAPVMACSPLMMSPCRPMMRPTYCLLHSTVRSMPPGGTARAPGVEATGVRSRSSSRDRQAWIAPGGPLSNTCGDAVCEKSDAKETAAAGGVHFQGRLPAAAPHDAPCVGLPPAPAG
jgi:hypothetical protein